MLKQFVEHAVKQLVDNKDAVVVTQTEKDTKEVFEVRVAAEDLGKVIGKGGQTIRSIRSIVGIIASQDGREILVEVSK